jgi:hypothetical protein
MAPLCGRPWGLQRPVTLSEVLDRVLNKGAVLSGEVVISVAGIDLLYLGINVLVSSVETIRQSRQPAESCHELSRYL